MSSSFITRAGLSRRAVILALAGMLAGVLLSHTVLAPVRAGSVAPAATARWTSCPGAGFYPMQSTAAYGNNGVARVGSSAVFACGLTIPHNATVTAVEFHLFDVRADVGVEQCSLRRVRLDPPDGSSQVLAGPLTSGAAFHDGYATRTTTSISNAVVNDRFHAYWAQCTIPVLTENLGIVGVSVRYTPG